MSLKDQILVASVFVDSILRFLNTSGTPVFSAQDNSSGELLADVYTLTLSAVSAGHGTVTVGASSANNPYAGRVVTGVALDSATIYNNIIPGVDLKFTTGGANGNTATVNIGLYNGTFDAFGGGAGVPSAAVRHQVVNTGSGAAEGCLASLQTQAIMVKITGSALAYVKPFATGATEKVLTGTRTEPYRLTLANVAGAGPTRVADLKVDGVTLGAASVMDLTTGVAVSGAGLKALAPVYPYRIITGPLTGVEFAISSVGANGDAANVLIFPSRYVQIASEVAGSPGAFGVTDVVLTEAGQAAGIITPAGNAYFYTRIVVPSGANSESNPYPGNVSISGIETGAANWTGSGV